MIRTATIGLVLMFGLAGCGGSDGSAEKSESLEASIAVELRWPLIEDTLTTEAAAPEECKGALDYQLVQTGSTVTFRDGNDEIVGVAKLEAPDPADNLVVCTWTASASLDAGTKFVTAEVGGWTSIPTEVSSGRVDFKLDTVKEGPEFGSEAELDPSWTK